MLVCCVEPPPPLHITRHSSLRGACLQALREGPMSRLGGASSGNRRIF